MSLDFDTYTNNLPYASSKKDKALNEAWHAENARLERQFQVDLLAELGLTDHPKADLLWKKAWDHGHANGFSEVYYWADEFAEMLR